MFSVIIPSKNIDNLAACLQAVRSCEDDNPRIIVIDDGLEIGGASVGLVGNETIPGVKPFSFPRNVNLGVKAAGRDDVWILNDDALLRTPNGFSEIAQLAEQRPDFGIISATTNVAGNRSQFPMGIGLREEPRTVAFVCVFIPRRTFDLIGLMDERFGGLTEDGRRIYGFCDNDMCRRIREAGLKIGIHDGVFVDHGSLTSEFRGDPNAAGDISAAGEIYAAKWGDWA